MTSALHSMLQLTATASKKADKMMANTSLVGTMGLATPSSRCKPDQRDAIQPGCSFLLSC